MRRITFLIGNGFDINVGLKTSYKDFLRYYISKNPEDMISKQISKDLELIYWSNLEIELGKFTGELSKEQINSFLDSKDLLENSLIDYLEDQSGRISLTDDQKTKISNEMVKSCTKFYLDFPIKNKNIVLSHIQSIFDDLVVSFISFNYTNTLERCLGILESNELGVHKDRRNQHHSIKAGDVIHVHGTIESEMILGVNDSGQILNNDFKENELLCNCLIKKDANIALGENRIEECKKVINESPIICIFGMSLGATDKMWWNYIISWLNQNSERLLVVFVYDQTIKGRYTNRQLFSKQLEILGQLKEYSGKNDTVWSSLKERIIVKINSNIFDFKVV